MRQFSFILIFTFLLSGCVNSYTDSVKFKYVHSTEVTNFSNLTENLIEQLTSDLNNVKEYAPLYITDFVNLKDLENFSELGFMLSDELKTHVTQKYNIPIYEIEFGKVLKIGAKGTKLLTRKSNEIKNDSMNSNTYALVGTYAFTQRQLILYLKLIELKSGIIIKSATQKTTLTDEIIHFELNPMRNTPQNIYQPMVL